MNATAVAAALGARALMRSVGGTCPTAASRDATGPRATSAAPKGARSSSASHRPASAASGPTHRPASTATCWTSSASPPARGSLRAALAEARAFLALPPAAVAGGPDTYDRTEAARRLWRRCRAIDGTHAEAYLRARALHRCRFPALRFHPSLMYRDAGGMRRLPALVAAVTGDDGAIAGVQRTWLDPRRPAKAPVAHPRKALGRIHGLAVRFGAPAAGRCWSARASRRCSRS